MTNARRLTVFNELLTLPDGMIILLLSFLFPIGIPMAHGQIDSIDVASQLKTATVYFVTPTAGNKIAVLKKELTRLSESHSKARITQMIKREQMEADSFSRALITAVEQHFMAAKYDFIADTSIRTLLDDQNESSKPFFLVRRSKTESGVDALVLYNQRMIALSRPAPYYARLTGFTSFIDALFGKKVYNWNNLDKVIRRWSERIEDFLSQ